MIVRVIAVMGGLALGTGLSQFPEYSQQYLQRLSGAVSELDGVVARFDADAADLGLDRQAALAEMRATGGMAEARAESMAYVLERHRNLSRDLAALTAEGPAGKVLNAWRFTDPKLARATWAAYRPALPLTLQGAGFAAAGLMAGYCLFGGLCAGIGRLAGRRRMAGPA
jgi:outer membrane murein-binding lipoprotein Lpp